MNNIENNITVTDAMDVLKAAGCKIQTTINLADDIIFVVYVPLSLMPNEGE